MAAGDAQRPDPVSQVEIYARPMTRSRIRAEMLSIEGRFFDEYNALNKNDDFDVFCNRQSGMAPRVRVCRPAFVVNDVMHYTGSSGGGGSADAGLAGISGGLLQGSAVAQPYMTTSVPDQRAKWAAYEKHMLELIDRHPQLRSLLSDWETLEKRYRYRGSTSDPNVR